MSVTSRANVQPLFERGPGVFGTVTRTSDGEGHRKFVPEHTFLFGPCRRKNSGALLPRVRREQERSGKDAFRRPFLRGTGAHVMAQGDPFEAGKQGGESMHRSVGELLTFK